MYNNYLKTSLKMHLKSCQPQRIFSSCKIKHHRENNISITKGVKVCLQTPVGKYTHNDNEVRVRNWKRGARLLGHPYLTYYNSAISINLCG